MNKSVLKLAAFFLGVVLFAGACAQRTCPTYADVDTQEEAKKVEATV